MNSLLRFSRFARFIAGLSLLLFLTGCFQESRILWAPNGKVAVVLGETGCFLCDEEGKLTSLAITNVVAADWFSDSKRMAIATVSICSNWSSLSAKLPDPLQNTIMREGALMVADCESGKSIRPSDEKRGKKSLPQGVTGAALGLYLKEKYPDIFRENASSLLAGKDNSAVEVTTVRMAMMQTSNVTVSAPLMTSLYPLFPRVSPTSKAIAIVEITDEKHGANIFLTPVDASSMPRLVASNTAFFPDWTKDGQSLVFIKSSSVASPGDELTLGVLAREVVLKPDGTPLEEACNANNIETNSEVCSTKNQPEELAGVLFHNTCKVRCLSDGQILFSTADTRLPISRYDMSRNQQIFSFDAERHSIVIPVIPQSVRARLPDIISLFEVSPDGKLLMVAGVNSAVYAIRIATAESWEVSPAQENAVLRTLPVWKSTNELCLIKNLASQVTGRATKAEVVLWSLGGKTKSLSSGWPAEVIHGLLD